MFSREEHIFYKDSNMDPASLDKYAKVLYALIKTEILERVHKRPAQVLGSRNSSGP